MLFKQIAVLNERFEIEEDRYVVIEGERISYIGETMPKGDLGRIYDGKGKLLMSGFYNAHAHSPMTLMRGYGENLALQDWLGTKIFPFEAQLDSNAVYWGTMLAMAESLRFGIVSTSDMYYFCDDMARAVEESGAKANISRSITNPSGEDPETLASFSEMKDFYQAFHHRAEDRIRVDMSLHGEYTSDEPTARALADYARQLEDVVMHVHVSETKLEHAECKIRHGLTPAAYLEKTGIFDIPAIAAHCVYAEEGDLEIFKRKGVTVAANPVSNMKLASGICNTESVLRKGINLAIGTDSVASNNNLNFFEEIKLMAIGSKIAASDPKAVMPEEVLRAATRGGALAQGRNDCGLVKEGCKADLILLDISQPNMHPVHRFINNLVYSMSGGDVCMTIVDGKILYENGHYETIDVERVVYEAQKATNQIIERL